jgi:hypothetical protein
LKSGTYWAPLASEANPAREIASEAVTLALREVVNMGASL